MHHPSPEKRHTRAQKRDDSPEMDRHVQRIVTVGSARVTFLSRWAFGGPSVPRQHRVRPPRSTRPRRPASIAIDLYDRPTAPLRQRRDRPPRSTRPARPDAYTTIAPAPRPAKRRSANTTIDPTPPAPRSIWPRLPTPRSTRPRGRPDPPQSTRYCRSAATDPPPLPTGGGLRPSRRLATPHPRREVRAPPTSAAPKPKHRA
jgi:hypothetical protein